MLKKIQLLLLFIFLTNSSLQALKENQIPASLLEWKAWVLDEIKEKDCPINYQKNTSQCSWFSKVEVTLDAKELNFSMEVTLYKDKTTVKLPHAHLSWPKEVLVNGEKAIVLGDNSSAEVILDKGTHKITGSIVLKEELKYIQLPKDIALVSFVKNNQPVNNAKVDANARLWLDQEQRDVGEKGTLVVSLYRKVLDGHPLRMHTYLHLRVSGKMRSVILDGILLDGFLPTAVKSSLNSTITEDRKLEIEVKAGEWTAVIDSYNPNNIAKLQKPNYRFNYANEEIWTLLSDANYRTIEVEGVSSLDPSQTTLPKSWKQLPAYLVEEGKTFSIKELYKSAKQQQKNELVLQRKMWLDFDGQGYTISDNIDATISQVRRLEATNILDLASASINNQPTLITTLDKSVQKGVELREQNMQIIASSRYEGEIGRIPANGWDEKFSTVSTILNLPPGWQLFAAFGSDNKTTAWLDKWNLMDIFLVLLLGIAIYQLYGIKWAVPATLFLILLWHEYDAPTIIWLIVLALVAMLRVVSEGRLKKVLKFLMVATVAIAVLQVLSFSVYEIRTALYPQLEKEYYGNFANDSYTDKSIQREVYQQVQDDSLQEEVMVAPNVQQSYPRKSISSSNVYAPSPKQSYSKKFKEKDYSQIMQNRIDPNAVVQTGIGKPKWKWHSHRFTWQSGVGSSDRLELWLVSPMLNKFLKALNIMGMLFLLYMFLREFRHSMLPSIKANMGVGNVGKMALFVSLLLINPNQLQADMPSEKMLTQLKEKLMVEAPCLPNCASIESLEVLINDEVMNINMEISAGADISVPLLANRNMWLPQKVLVDAKEDVNLNLDSSGGLWLRLSKGVHKVTLSGSIKGHHQLMLSSRLAIHNFSAKVNNAMWRVGSDHKSYIEISNLNIENQKAKETSKIEPLVELERTFYFGQRWYVDTKVKLLNKIDKPYSLMYELLPNESILDKEIEVKGNQAVLHLSNKKRSHSWRSSLAITKELALKASNKNQLLEVWQMDIASIWDMTYKGIEPIEQLKVGARLMPRFKPWHDEILSLTLEKAKAVKGESLTIESSKVKLSQSARYRDVTLDLSLKSSQAGQYVISLNSATKLKPTVIDGRTHYLKISEGKVSIPLQAKAQKVKLSWREEMPTNVQYDFSNIDLGKTSTNNSIELTLAQNRWILWTNGPLLGPAILLWGVLLAVLLFAVVLGRIKGSPLKTRDWLLLGVGVSTSSVMIMLPIIVWIFTLRYREIKGDALIGWKRNFTQIGLVFLTLIAIGTIIGAVSGGLLGNPEMMITGNNSYDNHLNWYSDRISGIVPEPTVVSVSIWYYRALMLLWSIWIAFSLIKWLKWAWAVFSQGDMWSKKLKELRK
ncbi:MAG: Unknown protein [uncultured Sulfurovum sp.]|uniref:Uncharacterized protein n=1 Tax=uncultured Sulfurovum sp. TaxID=269237 RepID=A0A6S6T0K8_9BACT|nr:MAG: Unknown protein [uncultured Sulfurovum sp.]